MIYPLMTATNQEEYKKLLCLIGSLSNLFSESDVPYLYYRIAEKIFCKAFNAEDLSRSDVSVDAKYYITGVGIKTFIRGNNKTYQKITEFGSCSRQIYQNLSVEDKIQKIAEIRNERILTTHRIHGIKQSIYHCLVREQNRFNIFEEEMSFINLSKIKNIKESTSSISFSDDIADYSFNLSKNTLLKRFRTDKFLDYFDIQIINDPLSILSKILNVSNQPHCNFQQNIFLPLYGEKNGKYEVFPRSGLNQWNARGRTRDCNEAYIRVPQIIHQKFADFFPSRDTKFDLKLPNGNIISAKICQEGGKALMSDPNKELGKWILRDVLDLKEGELLTYEKLANLNIDSVRIDKISERSYLINFAKIGSYENFIALLPNSP